MRIHFIGIGGIGVSALARHYLSQNHQVTGSDLEPSEITQALQKLGARVHIGKHKRANLWKRFDLKNFPRSNLDLVVYSPAITSDNPELKKARKQGVRCQSYPQALGELTKNHFTIAVCGTHGKGTTTAMISLILIKAGLDPSVIIGTKLKEFGDSNYRPGKSPYLVIEADEYQSSFLNYRPQIIVLTTIDEDHLDYFKNLANIVKTFQRFIDRLPQKGILVVNRLDKNSQGLKSSPQVKYYSLKQKEARLLKRRLKLPGDHILADALGALTLARSLKIPDEVSFRALSEYKGAWRRFEESELKIGNCKLKIVSDYAHHPTEVEVTLKAARQKYPNKKIWCVFQPHQYQRTYYLFDDFARVLSQAPVDKLILTDIYSVAGRESQSIKKKVSSKKLVRAIVKNLKIPLRGFPKKYGNCKLKIKTVFYIPTLKKTANYLKQNLRSKEVLVVMGAGDIYQLPLLLTSPKRKGKMN